MAGGYLKVISHEEYKSYSMMAPRYELALTNWEVKLMFHNMVRGWFARNISDYSDFIKALLMGDKKAMNVYMNRVALSVFGYFDTGKNPSGYAEPENSTMALCWGCWLI